ncbi:hypothetical protein ACRTLG_004458, partial [Escherichia coli]
MRLGIGLHLIDFIRK